MGAGNTLTSNATFGGVVAPTNAGLAKTGDGKLLLNSASGNNYTGLTTISLGTLELAAAAPNNALFYRFATSGMNAITTGDNDDALVITAGGTLELNGNSQVFGDLLARNGTVGSGGVINNAGSLATFTTTVNTAREWTGQINGSLNFVKSGGAQFTVRNDNQFTGNATIMGSIVALVDQGRFSGMAAGDTISIRNSLLRWDDSGIQAMGNRIGSDVAIQLDGGAFEFISRSGTAGTVTLGNLSLTGGSSILRANPGNTGLGQATISLGGTFTRTANSTLTFIAGTGSVGANPFFTAAAAGLTSKTNGILGAWALTSSASDPLTGGANLGFATYDSAVGFRPLALPELVPTLALASGTSNVRFNGTQTVTAGGQTINTLTLNGAAATVNFAAGSDTLTFAAGGLLSGSDNAARTIGSASVRGRIASSASEFFLHNGANTLTINADITGTTSPVFTSGGLVGGANIRLTNANTYVGSAFSNGVNLLLDNQTGTGSAITGDLTITGGNAGGADTGALTSAALRNLVSNQIADTAAVTVRGGAIWELNGFNETVARVAFNSQGGISGGSTITTGLGQLTLTDTANTISASSLDDVRVIAHLAGRLSLPSTATVTVARVADGLTTVMGTAGQSNEQVGLAINASILAGGTINKEGLGVLQLGGFSSQSLTVNVNAGTLVIGPNSNGSASNYADTAVNLAASGTILDMRGNTNVALGTVSGVAGTIIKNFHPTAGSTLVTGNAVSGTFAGTFVSDFRYGDSSSFNVNKIGSGDWTLSGDSSASLLGTFSIFGGAVVLDQATGKLGFVTTNLGLGGVLTLNGANALSDRLGGVSSIQAADDRVFNNRGGVLNYAGSSTAAVVETLRVAQNVAGQTVWNLTQNTGNQTRITIATFNAQSGTLHGALTLNAGATGTLGGGAAGANRVNVIVTTPNLTGTNPAVAGSVTNGVRPDIIGIDSSNTVGGFVTHDANGFRLLTSSEYRGLLASSSGTGVVLPASMNNATTITLADASGLFAGMAVSGTGVAANSVISSIAGNTVTLSAATTGGAQVNRLTFGATATANFVTAASAIFQQATTVQSLTLNSGGGVGYFGGGNLTSANSPSGQLYGLGGALNTLTITSGGVIANAGNVGFAGGSVGAGGNPLHFHVLGGATTLTFGSTALGSGGLIKSGNGVMTLSRASYNSGGTTVNNGTLRLGAGLAANPLLVIPTATVPTVAELNVNGGTFDLNGNTQAFRRLTQYTSNAYANGAGTVTNSSTSAATLLVVQDNTAATFSGAISGGNINFEKQGSNNLTLVSAGNLGNGSLSVRGGALVLRDDATLTTTGAVAMRFGQLTLDNSGITRVAGSRIGTGAISLTGGTLSVLAGPLSDSLSLGALTINGGANVINNRLFADAAASGSSSVLTFASLTRGSSVQSTINFTSAGGNLGGPVGGVTNASNLQTLNGGANPQILFTAAPTVTNSIIGGWAVINGADFAGYRSTIDPITGAIGVGNLGFSANGQTSFGNYANSLEAGTANDNTTSSVNNATITDITSRTVNSIRISRTDASGPAQFLMRSMAQLISVTSGGILTNQNGQAVNFLNGRMTAGTTANSAVYVWANNGTTQFLNRFENNGGGAVSFVKSGPATVGLRVEPRLDVNITTSGSPLVTTEGANSTGAAGVPGVVVGMGFVSSIMGMPTGSIVTEVNSGTTYTISQNVGTGTGTNANQTMTAPVTQVIGGLSLTAGAATVTVPAGTIVYPGMSVTTAAGSTGVLAANSTVLSVSGTTVTLSANATTAGAARLLFGTVGAQTNAAVTNTSGTNVLTITNATPVNVGQPVTGTGIPTGAYVTAVSGSGAGSTITLSASTTAAVTQATFAALSDRSIIASTVSASPTARVFSSAGLFVGQSVQGPGIAPGTTVAGIVDANTITLSQNALATGAGNAYFAATPAVGRTAIGALTSASSAVTMASSAEVAGLAVGMYVQGVGIPQNTVIGSISGTTVNLVSATTGAAVNASATHAASNLIFGAPIANFNAPIATTLGAAATSGATTLTVASAAGLAAGMPVFVNGLANGTTIASITGNVVTLSTATTAAITNGTAVTFTSPLPYFSNTYTGDTVVNQGTLNISNAASQLGGIMVPGNLILNNANATQATHNGSIASTSNVTLNGGSVLTLVGQNTFASVTFNNIGGTATPTVTGGTIFVTGAITATNDNYASTPIIASALELNGQSKTITVGGSSPMGLILSGVVQNAMNSAVPAGLIKAGASSLVLSGANTFAGGVQLNAGTLIIGAASTGSTAGTAVTSGPLGTGVLTVAAGTTLQSDNTARIVANNLTINGNTIFGGTAATHNLTFNGRVNLGAANRTLTVTSPQVTTTFGGIISGSAGGLTKVGNGILVLTPQTTGALSASGAASNATVSGSADLTLSATAAGGIAVGMPVSGPGIAFGTTVASVAGSVVTLSKNAVATAGNGTFAFGTTQTYVPSAGASGTSSITVSLAEAANLVVGSTVTGVGVAASSTVTAVDTATGVVTLNNALTAAVTGQNLTFGGATATASFNDYAGTTTVSGGLLRLGNLGALPSTTALVVLSGGTLELQASTTVASLAGDSSTTGGLITASGTSGTIQLNVNGSANTAFGGAITNNVGSTFNFNKQGSGTLTLGGPNTFTGATTVSGGTLTTLAGSLAGTSGITVNGAILTAADFNSGATLALNATGRATISGAGQNVGAVTNANATDANALNFTASTGIITLASLSGAGKTTFGSDATVTGAISDGVVNVTGALIAGSITGGTNTITGAATVTTVNGGTTTVGGVANITTLTTGTLNANGATAAVTTLNGGNIALGSSTALTVSDGTHAGVISGATGTLTKSGAGTLILSGANTFGGAITISAGKLQIGAGSTTGSIGAGAIANSGILEISRSDNLSFANVISGTGSLTKSAAGTLTLATANTFDGGVTIAANGGTVIVGHNNALGTGQVTLAGNTAQLTLADGITVANAMLLTSTGGLQARTLGLQAGATSATYAGAISNLSTNTLAFTVDAGGTLTVSGIISGNGLSKTGDGTAILSGANSYTGATTVSAGTLQVASESNLGAVPASFVDGHLTLGAASTQGILKSAGTTSLSANRGVTLAAGGGAFDVAASTTLTIASAVTGTGALTKSGAGLLDIKMGTPQYGGTTTINGGTLRFTNVADLGAVSTMVFNINNGSTLEFQSSVGGSNRTVLNNKTFTFGASGGGTINFNGGNNLMQNGVHDFVTTGGAKNTISQTNGGLINNQSSGNTVFNVADGTDAVDLELSAQWVNGTLTKAGLGVMAITGVHTGNFDLDIDAGVLEIGGSASLNGGTFTAAITNDGTFRYGSSAAQTMSGIISGTGALTKLGSGNLTLSGANAFTGATLVSAGTLTVSAGALAGTSGITVNGAIFAAANYNLAATLALDTTATATISGETLTITGAVTNAGTTDNALNFSASTGIITLTSLAGAGKTRFGSDADVLGGISAGTVTVVGALGANITGGTVTAGSLAGAVSGGNVTVTNLLTGGVSAGTVNAGSLTGDITGGAVTVTGALTGNVTAGTVSAGSMAGNVGSSVTISGLLNGEITAGTNSLGSLSSASVTGGTNTITGAATVTTVNGGTTTVGGVATVTTLTTGTLTFNGASGSIGTLTDGTFNLNGAAATVGTLTAGTINLAASTALTVDSGTFSGSLAGSGSLIKATSGILTLTGANASFSGATTISLGELIIQNAGSLGTSAITVASGAILDLNNIGITNAITVASGGIIENGPTAASPAVVAALSGTNSIDTVLTGTTGLAKDGSGELSLTTPNFFTGAVTANTAGAVISAAYLADDSSSLGASALTDPTKLVLGNGATLEFTGATATTTSRSFTVNGAAGLAVDAAAAPLTFSSSSIMALDPADSTPELKLTAFNSGVNRFEAQLSADDIAAGRGLSNLAIDGTGKWVLGGSANRFKGDVRVDVGGGGTLGFESGSLGMGSTYASSDIVVANGSTLAWSGSGNTDDISARLQVPANAIAKLDLGANNVTFATAPDMGAGASLQKQGSGTLNVSFSAPTLNVAVSSGTLSVNGSLGAITLTNGATLGGAGTIVSANVGNGATLAPGNSPGTLNATSLTFVGGSYFDWQVQDATDLTNGFDKINLSGSLDLTGASASNRVKFRITSLLGAGNGTTLGEPLNFAAPGVAAQPTVFQFGTVAAGGSGVLLNSGLNISDVFEIDVTGFKYSDGSSSNAGLWSIDWDGGTSITLTAVPEPSTYGFAMGALALAAAAIRRRKRQATKA